MAKKKKSKADKRPSQHQSAQHSATRDDQIAQHDTSPPQKQSSVKQEPQIIDVDQTPHSTPTKSPNQKGSQPPQNRSSQQTKQEPDLVTPATKSCKKRTRSSQHVSTSDEAIEPTPKSSRTSASNTQKPSSVPKKNPGEKTMLCETVVEQKGFTDVVVTTKEQYPTAVRCPCQMNCGKFVRVGPYAKYARIGTPFCPHCRSCLGSENGFNSYPQLLAHVNTRTCRAVQKTQPCIPISEPHTKPKRMTARKVLGPKKWKKVSDPCYKIHKNGSVYFKCFKCSMEVEYNEKFRHCVECLTH